MILICLKIIDYYFNKIIIFPFSLLTINNPIAAISFHSYSSPVRLALPYLFNAG